MPGPLLGRRKRPWRPEVAILWSSPAGSSSPRSTRAALRRGCSVSGSAGQAVLRPRRTRRRSGCARPQRAARAPPGVHARQRRPQPPRQAAPASSRLCWAAARARRAQVPGTGCEAALLVSGLRNGDPEPKIEDSREHKVQVQERLRAGRGTLPSATPQGSHEKGTLSDPHPILLSPRTVRVYKGQQELQLHAAWRP